MPGCNGCGSCCEWIEFDVRENREWVIQWAGCADPRVDLNWRKIWTNWKDDQRESCIRKWLDACFIVDHWIDQGEELAVCDAFDESTRSCLVYDDRPPVCQDFPFYGGEPSNAIQEQVPWCGYLETAGIKPRAIPVKIRRRIRERA
jgi:Fe-S-cluster containining protein